MLKRFFRRLILALLLATLVIAAILGTAQRFLDAPITLPDSQLTWTISNGTTLNEINRQLYQQGIVSHPKLLSLYAQLQGKARIQAGEYRLTSTDTAKTLLNKFNEGQITYHQITFPEGWTFAQWLTHLAKLPQFAEVKELPLDTIMTASGIQQAHPEGWLFPDTYSYVSSDPWWAILARAHQRMLDVLSTAWETRDADLPYSSAYEALIMASIVEKETGLAEERAEIAGVFVRRLNKGMRLQTDPTVIYGLGDAYSGNIKRSHLKQTTPYNTYVIKGLPPTPIAMPSEAAIYAAVHPLPGSSLYFVARGDGGHYFSDSLEEHQKAVRQYQINRRAADYRSAPPSVRADK